MSESGRAPWELLAVNAGTDPAATALVELEVVARGGGEPAARSVRRVVMTSRRLQAEWAQRAGRAERDLAMTQATIRAMVGQPDRLAVLVPIDPPAGHLWNTIRAGTALTDHLGVTAGRLYCSTCTVDQDYGAERPVLAAECLERAR